MTLESLVQIEMVLGFDLAEEQRAATARILSDRFTEAQIETATEALLIDTELAEKVRYGRVVCPADYNRVLTDGPAARANLLTYHEALHLWDRRGCPGTFPATLFERVEVEDRIYYRRR